MDVSKLILLVQNYPELYDSQHPNYCNNLRRNSCWEKVSAMMNEPASVCKDRWTKIRDNHRKALQRRRTKIGAKQKPPKYEKELQFLVPFIRDEDNRESNFSPFEEATVNADEDNEDGFPDLEDPLLLVTPQIDSQTSSMNRPRSCSSSTSSTVQHDNSYVYRKRKRSDFSKEKTAAAALDEHLKRFCLAQVEAANDPLTSVFMAMSKTVQGFPIRDQIEVKRAVFNIIIQKEIDIASRDGS